MHARAWDMSFAFRIRALADASAALGIMSGRVVANACHLGTNRLWIWELAASKGVKYESARGVRIPSDLVARSYPTAT